MEQKEIKMLDIRVSKDDLLDISIMTSPAGLQTLYVNIDGVCRFRLVSQQPIVIE